GRVRGPEQPCGRSWVSAGIEQICTATRVVPVMGQYLRWRRAGPGAVLGQLCWSAGLLGITCLDGLRPEVYSAVGDLADVAVAVDVGADEVGRVYRFALACAEEANDWQQVWNLLRSDRPGDDLRRTALTHYPD
ncbi:MAG: hypothetical protein ACRDQ9_18360, partial [Pseudonocardiaceae bacterium]